MIDKLKLIMKENANSEQAKKMSAYMQNKFTFTSNIVEIKKICKSLR